MKLPFTFKKVHFIYTFCVIVLLLALVRCIFPSVAKVSQKETKAQATPPEISVESDSVIRQAAMVDTLILRPRPIPTFTTPQGEPIKHRIYSVQSFKNSFPDLNDVQLATAQRLGVEPVKSREEAVHRKGQLVYIGNSPYFYVEPLKHSIPYLIPKASNLLNHIARVFLDSLEIKQIPLHTLIVTSVLRTEKDIEQLRRHNGNASAQSCHRYGTTFDICYNRYRVVEDPDGPKARPVRNDTLKWVLSEVLNDQRKPGTCYIKYEVHQGCFHITAR